MLRQWRLLTSHRQPLSFHRPGSLRCEPSKAAQAELDVAQLGFFRRLLLRLGGASRPRGARCAATRPVR